MVLCASERIEVSERGRGSEHEEERLLDKCVIVKVRESRKEDIVKPLRSSHQRSQPSHELIDANKIPLNGYDWRTPW